MSKIKLIRFIVCGLISVLGFISQANATPTTVGFISSTAHLSFIPPNSSGSDQFSMQGASGTINLDSVLPTVNFVNVASLLEGQFPCPFNSCAGSGGFSSSFGLTLLSGQSGYGQIVAQPATWTSAPLSGDTVVAGPGSPVLFVLTGIGSWEVTLNPYDIHVQGPGAGGNAAVFATFTPVPIPAATPEPASVILFATGLLSIVLLLRKNLLA